MVTNWKSEGIVHAVDPDEEGWTVCGQKAWLTLNNILTTVVVTCPACLFDLKN